MKNNYVFFSKVLFYFKKFIKNREVKCFKFISIIHLRTTEKKNYLVIKNIFKLTTMIIFYGNVLTVGMGGEALFFYNLQ